MTGRILFAALATTVLQSAPCFAFSINDCILEGMKGISSDAAARAVTKACEEKREDARQKSIAALTKEYGEPIDPSLVAKAKNYSAESSGKASIQITNHALSPERTIRYVNLSVSPTDANGHCNPWDKKTYAYKLMLPPSSSTQLTFPMPGFGGSSVCTEIITARAALKTWKDISIAGAANPMEKDPFDDPSLLRNYGVAASAPVPGPLPPLSSAGSTNGKNASPGVDLTPIANGDFSELVEKKSKR